MKTDTCPVNIHCKNYQILNQSYFSDLKEKVCILSEEEDN